MDRQSVEHAWKEAVSRPQCILNPEAAKLLDRMVGPPPSHHRFVGKPIDWAQIDPLALGDVWATAQALGGWRRHPPSSGLAADTARAVLERGREMEPAFRGTACAECLDLLAFEAEKASGESTGYHLSSILSEVRFVLSRCIDFTFEGVNEAAGRCLAAMEWGNRPHLALALARLAGCEARILEQLSGDLAGSPLLIAELRAVAALDISTNVAIDKSSYYSDGVIVTEDGLEHLSGDPNYVAFGETVLRQAAERVRRIHDGTSPYASDKAFTSKESDVVARLSRVALARDAPWLSLMLDELFRKVSIAPTAAKTLPSQAVAIALGHAIEAFPTPEAVATLRAVLRDIRHAGVKKKLQRNVRGAERGLADRPEVALRLPVGLPVSKQQMATLMHCLEAGLTTGLTVDYDNWRGRLAEHPQAKALAGALVWWIVDADRNGPSILPAIERGRLVLRDAAGASVSIPKDCRVRLWHPCEATATERDTWRDRVAALRIKQPFKQVFREHYAVPDDELTGNSTAVFAGHAVSVRPLLGLARRERWSAEYDGLTRSFGDWTARLDLADHIYPGHGGGTTTGKLSLWTSRRYNAAPVRLSGLPAAMLSEILRAVDLLVSVGGFGLNELREDRERGMRLWHLAQSPLGAMAEMRRQALQHALRGFDGMADLQFDARHLRLGRYAIHLATGRVTCDGDPVIIDLPKRSNLSAVPWLPFDEKLLETICYTAIEIAARKADA